MPLCTKDRSCLRDQSGVAILEFGLIASILILFFSVSVDFGRAFVQHGYISRIAYECARFAAALPQPVNTSCSGQVLAPCADAWAESVRVRMQQLVVEFVAEHPTFDISSADITKSIELDSTTMRITIRLDLPFYPITPGFVFLSTTSETVIGPSLFL